VCQSFQEDHQEGGSAQTESQHRKLLRLLLDHDDFDPGPGWAATAPSGNNIMYTRAFRGTSLDLAWLIDQYQKRLRNSENGDLDRMLVQEHLVLAGIGRSKTSLGRILDKVNDLAAMATSRDEIGYTLLHRCAWVWARCHEDDEVEDAEGMAAMIARVVEAAPDVNAVDGKGRTVLRDMARQVSRSVVRSMGGVHHQMRLDLTNRLDVWLRPLRDQGYDLHEYLDKEISLGLLEMQRCEWEDETKDDMSHNMSMYSTGWYLMQLQLCSENDDSSDWGGFSILATLWPEPGPTPFAIPGAWPKDDECTEEVLGCYSDSEIESVMSGNSWETMSSRDSDQSTKALDEASGPVLVESPEDHRARHAPLTSSEVCHVDDNDAAHITPGETESVTGNVHAGRGPEPKKPKRRLLRYLAKARMSFRRK
jgi:hypothetical protein